jgi:hypothetical protein
MIGCSGDRACSSVASDADFDSGSRMSGCLTYIGSCGGGEWAAFGFERALPVTIAAASGDQSA